MSAPSRAHDYRRALLKAAERVNDVGDSASMLLASIDALLALGHLLDLADEADITQDGRLIQHALQTWSDDAENSSSDADVASERAIFAIVRMCARMTATLKK